MATKIDIHNELNSVEEDSIDELSKSKNFYWTGHPFVDAGLAAVLIFSGKNKPHELTGKDVISTIEFISELYSKEEWVKYLHGKIFPNSGLLMVNPSMKRNRKPENLAGRLKQLYDSIEPLKKSHDRGVCAVCGRREIYKGDYEVYRSIFPLLGTGGMLNFFPSANENGFDLCSHCLFLTQFMPLTSYNLPNVLLIHSYPYEKMIEFSKEPNIYATEYKLVSSARNFRKPENFLFRKIMEITRKVESKSRFWEHTIITLYYFINGNRSGQQKVDIIQIPNSALKFISFAGEKEYNGWKTILNMGWVVKKAKKDELSFEDLEKGYSNNVYQKILNEESILPYFYNSNKKKANAKWRLLEFYCLEVLGLDKDTLKFIKEVGDKIVETIDPLSDNKLKKVIRELETAKKLYQFSNFFIQLEKIRQKNNLKNAFLSFDEFSLLLTGYGEELNTSWYTVKNLLLFRIYEKMHNRLIKIDLDEEIEENDDEMPYGGE